MSDELLRIAQLEEQKLIAELRLLPAFQKLEAIATVLEVYKSAAGADRPQVVVQMAAPKPPADPSPVTSATPVSASESGWRQTSPDDKDPFKVDKIFR
jgi:hypothetical protein